MKTIDYLCGMNYVSQYQQALRVPSRPQERVYIEDVATREYRVYDTLGPYGPTYDFWGVPFSVWNQRGEKFMRGDYSLGDY